MLESLVRLNPAVAFKSVEFGIEFDAVLVNRMALRDLPADWLQEPPPTSTQALGDVWVKSGNSAILVVPGVILLSETNYLLNPVYPAFSKIRIAQSEAFVFDPRLLK